MSMSDCPKKLVDNLLDDRDSNLDDMIKDAINKINSMSEEEFKQEYIKAGYTPVRK